MAKNKIFIPYYISNEQFAPAKVLPRIFFYNGTKDCDIIKVQYYNTGSTLVTIDTFTAFPYFDNYSGEVTTTSSLSLLFTNEDPVYGVSYPSQSLFDKYWSKYIDLLYSPKTRLLRCSAVLPFDVYQQLELNDIVQLRSNYYHLRAINDYNLKTGECRMELLGPLLEGSLDEIPFFDNRCEVAPTVLSQSFNTSSNVLTFNITGSNCCNNPNELVIKLDFTTGSCPINFNFSASTNAYQPISTGSYWSDEPNPGYAYNIYYITSSTAISTGSGIPASDSRWIFATTVSPSSSYYYTAASESFSRPTRFNILATSGSYLYIQMRDSASGQMLYADRNGYPPSSQTWTSRVAKSGSVVNTILWTKLPSSSLPYDVVAPYTKINAEKGHVTYYKPNIEVDQGLFSNLEIWLNNDPTASNVTASTLTTASSAYPDINDTKWQPILATTASIANGHQLLVRGPWVSGGTPTSSFATATSYESEVSFPSASYLFLKFEKATTGSLNVDSASIATTSASIDYSGSMLRVYNNVSESTSIATSNQIDVYLTSSI